MTQQPPAPLVVDDLDRRLLAELARRPDLTNRALAAHLRAPESTCAYRLRRMEAAGLIRRGRLDIDPSVLGYGLQAIVVGSLHSHGRVAVEDFLAAVARAPGVQHVFNVSGQHDFVAVVAVRDAHGLRDLLLDHVTSHPIVRGTETHIVFDSRPGTWVPGTEPA